MLFGSALGCQLLDEIAQVLCDRLPCRCRVAIRVRVDDALPPHRRFVFDLVGNPPGQLVVGRARATVPASPRSIVPTHDVWPASAANIVAMIHTHFLTRTRSSPTTSHNF
ncbi:MAG: hypothetical protein MI923_19995 [Phycisphaerales bacterium]|nr:hypothetical protein [Phycisphaerales bacterium]